MVGLAEELVEREAMHLASTDVDAFIGAHAESGS